MLLFGILFNMIHRSNEIEFNGMKKYEIILHLIVSYCILTQ